MTAANMSCVLLLVMLYGQDQDCPGGCFSPANAFDGDMAVLRIWNRVLTGEEIKRNMMRERPESESGLVGLYIFDSEGVKNAQNGEPVALDRSSECAGLFSVLQAGYSRLGCGLCFLHGAAAQGHLLYRWFRSCVCAYT